MEQKLLRVKSRNYQLLTTRSHANEIVAAAPELYAPRTRRGPADDDAEKPQIILNPEVMMQMYEANPEEAAKYVFVSKMPGEAP